MFLISFFSAQLLASLSIAQAADSTADSFKELGSLFVWGIAGAVGAALVVVFIWLKIQSKREASSDHFSINPSKHSNQG
jgi:type VI protein secretion system component VasF